MKELQQQKPEKTEIHAVKPIKKEVKHIGSITLKKGQVMWEMDLKTRKISKAEYQVSAAKFDGSGVERKLITKENHLYCAAINAKNADKKFFKLLGLPYPKNVKPKPIN